MSNDKQEKPQKINGMAILSYLGILVLVPLLAAKNDSFVKFHAQQGLVLLIFGMVGMFIVVIPILGWILSPIISLTWLVFVILGILNVVANKKQKLPLIGKYADKFKI